MTTAMIESYTPPNKVKLLWTAYQTCEDKSMTAILDHAGLTWGWFYDTFQPDQEAVAWFNAQCEGYFANRTNEVWENVHAIATQPEPTAQTIPAAKLYVERFDPKYKPTTGVSHTIEARQSSEDSESRMARLSQQLSVTTITPAPRQLAASARRAKVDVPPPPPI